MRVAVVTGASSGIGAELVRTLGARGWHTIGLSRRPSDAAEHETCDVAERAAVDEIAARVLARHPRIDLLVNNAGLTARARFLDGDPAGIEDVIRVNYLGAVWVTRAFLPGLGEGSHLVNVVSVAGLIGDGPYSASKHALLAFSRTMAVQLGRLGVSVHTVNPGLIETEGFPQRARLGPIASRIVVDPPLVVERVLGAIEHDRREIVVPRWYRAPALLQALMPGVFARLRARSKR